MYEPGARRLMTDRPGATKSTVRDVPWLEKSGTRSLPAEGLPRVSSAPTAMTNGS
jgi:hypothetical protein